MSYVTDSDGSRVLVVDDDELVGRSIARALERRGYDTDLALDGEDALLAIDRERFELVLLDLNLPGLSGFDLLRRLRRDPFAPAVVVVSARDDLQSGVLAMRLGATDYVEKPVGLAELGERVDAALDTATLRRRVGQGTDDDQAILCESPAFRHVLMLAERVAQSPRASALLLGESGVGKEVVASFIHRRSARAPRPFVRVNVAALPDTMVEAELFGSVRGAYTGARRDRKGHFASADGGTLLLDEFCELGTHLQPKLLRAIEEQRFHPVGSDRVRDVDVRILAATNREPRDAIASGELRPDLFYRMSTVVLRIPPLRERREDVVPLARHFLLRFCAELGRSPLRLDGALERTLLGHRWPGNVRELRNAMERAALLADADAQALTSLDLDALTPPVPARERTPKAPPESGEYLALSRVLRDLELFSDEGPMRLDDAKKQVLAAVERSHIEKVLELTSGNATKAAELLGVSRTTLWSKVKRYGIR
ncbi:MAG: sigma-54 dependent transcriptional regulator [Myxococcota bacterium]